MYPDQWGMPAPSGYEWLADNYIKDRAELAHSLNKPSESFLLPAVHTLLPSARCPKARSHATA